MEGGKRARDFIRRHRGRRSHCRGRSCRSSRRSCRSRRSRSRSRCSRRSRRRSRSRRSRRRSRSLSPCLSASALKKTRSKRKLSASQQNCEAPLNSLFLPPADKIEKREKRKIGTLNVQFLLHSLQSCASFMTRTAYGSACTCVDGWHHVAVRHCKCATNA